jgi:ABC-2 type transport system ATP-binding protein
VNATERPGGIAALHEVSKAFGSLQALDDVSLSLHPGEVVALLGPNGAGKTTALRILLGLRRPDTGRAELFGGDPSSARYRRRVGVTPQDTDLPETLRVREIVDFARAHYPHPLATSDLLERFGLEELAPRQAGGLSGGQRRRVAIALAFAGDPDLVCLDEPSSGLDTGARRALWRSIRAFAERGRTILLTTHDLAEAEALASRVLLVRSGRLVRDASVPEITAGAGLTRIRLRAQPLPDLPGLGRVIEDGRYRTLLVRSAGEAMRALVAAGADLEELEVAPLTLEHALWQAEEP